MDQDGASRPERADYGRLAWLSALSIACEGGDWGAAADMAARAAACRLPSAGAALMAKDLVDKAMGECAAERRFDLCEACALAGAEEWGWAIERLVGRSDSHARSGRGGFRPDLDGFERGELGDAAVRQAWLEVASFCGRARARGAKLPRARAVMTAAHWIAMDAEPEALSALIALFAADVDPHSGGLGWSSRSPRFGHEEGLSSLGLDEPTLLGWALMGSDEDMQEGVFGCAARARIGAASSAGARELRMAARVEAVLDWSKDPERACVARSRRSLVSGCGGDAAPEAAWTGAFAFAAACGGRGALSKATRDVLLARGADPARPCAQKYSGDPGPGAVWLLCALRGKELDGAGLGGSWAAQGSAEMRGILGALQASGAPIDAESEIFTGPKTRRSNALGECAHGGRWGMAAALLELGASDEAIRAPEGEATPTLRGSALASREGESSFALLEAAALRGSARRSSAPSAPSPRL